MKTEPRECPLCKAAAVFYFVDHSDKRYYKCPSCSTFSISLTAEERIPKVSAEILSKLSDRARSAAEDETLSITKSTYDEMDQGTHLHDDMVSKKSLRIRV